MKGGKFESWMMSWRNTSACCIWETGHGQTGQVHIIVMNHPAIDSIELYAFVIICFYSLDVHIRPRKCMELSAHRGSVLRLKYFWDANIGWSSQAEWLWEFDRCWSDDNSERTHSRAAVGCRTSYILYDTTLLTQYLKSRSHLQNQNQFLIPPENDESKSIKLKFIPLIEIIRKGRLCKNAIFSPHTMSCLQWQGPELFQESLFDSGYLQCSYCHKSRSLISN